eukprot:TRINITY_DN277_c0_g1_i4.p1 TRINITY_DN277_c0_g1~~TRINITY_DN277_c0_g1_i4.p1  ORF type:complete len:718 (+),score=166.31 TRINITY_DN277_c0_g1_i4:275-2428(+)
MTLLLDYINNNTEIFNMTIQFSTVTEYMDHKHSLNLTFPLRPYVDFEIGWPHALGGVYNNTIQYQTGCLTTHPAYKQLIRRTQSLDRSAEVAYTLAMSIAASSDLIAFSEIADAREARAISQHHDSIPGTMSTSYSVVDWTDPNHPEFGVTSDSNVLGNYEEGLYNATATASEMLEMSISTIVQATATNNVSPPSLTLEQADVAIMTTMRSSSDDAGLNWTVGVVIWNSVPWPREEFVSIPVANDTQVCVSGEYAANATILPAVDGFGDSANATLLVRVSFESIGYRTLTVSAGEDCASVNGSAVVAVAPASVGSEATSITQGTLVVGLDANGFLQYVHNTVDNANVSVTQQSMTYRNGTGSAYILCETHPASTIAPPTAWYVIQAPCVTEIRQVFNNDLNLRQSLRVYGCTAAPSTYVEVVQHVGPIAMMNEVISRYTTDISTGGVFHTDDTGLDIRTRQYNASKEISANYHAHVASSFIKDETSATDPREMAVVTTQSMGMTSLADGQVEYMLHRRTADSDTQGPYPLNDTTSVSIQSRLIFGNADTVESIRPIITVLAQNPVNVLYTAGGVSATEWSQYSTAQDLVDALPPQVHLLTLMRRGPSNDTDEVVVRLQNIFEKEAASLFHGGLNATFANVSTIFGPTFEYKNATARSLTLMQEQSIMMANRMQWKTDADGMKAEEKYGSHTNRPDSVDSFTLSPFEIMTFVGEMNSP